MKSIARVYAHWSDMAKDIEGLVTYSVKCQLITIGLPRENPIPWQEMKKKPLSRVYFDFASPTNGVTYLVLCQREYMR